MGRLARASRMQVLGEDRTPAPDVWLNEAAAVERGGQPNGQQRVARRAAQPVAAPPEWRSPGQRASLSPDPVACCSTRHLAKDKPCDAYGLAGCRTLCSAPPIRVTAGGPAGDCWRRELQNQLRRSF